MKALSFYGKQKKDSEEGKRLAEQLADEESKGASRFNSSAMLQVNESSSSSFAAFDHQMLSQSHAQLGA